MEQYILNLLKENKRIIIPDFGAFIIRPLNPPEIAFNSLLTFNDGILTEYISKESGISYVEAAAKVSDYSEKLKTDLKQHNRLSFNEIGWVWTDDSGEMQFTAWKDNGKTREKPLAGLKDIASVLKETELPVTPDELKTDELINEDLNKGSVAPSQDSDILIHNNISKSPVNVTETAPFTLDENLKEVDVDATKDMQVQTGSEMNAGTVTGESFTLDESERTAEPSSSDQSPSLKNDTAKRKIDFEKAIAVDEPPVQQTDQIKDKDAVMDEKIMATLSAIKAQSAAKNGSRPESKLHELSPDDDWRRSEIKSAHSSTPVKEKKRQSWIIPVIIAGLICLLAGGAWIFFPDQVKNLLSTIRQQSEKTLTSEEATDLITGSEDEVADQISDQPAEQTSEKIGDQEQASEQDITSSGLEKEPVTSETVTPVVSDENKETGSRYYIVAGSFKSRTNAEQYVNLLRQKGFNAELFLTPDNLYRVSFSSFATRDLAEEELRRIRQTTEPDAWVLLH